MRAIFWSQVGCPRFYALDEESVGWGVEIVWVGRWRRLVGVEEVRGGQL